MDSRYEIMKGKFLSNDMLRMLVLKLQLFVSIKGPREDFAH